MPNSWRHLLSAAMILPCVSNTLAAPVENSSQSPKCRFIPSDAGWPSVTDWNSLNQSISGRLIAGQPLAHSCHGEAFVQSLCASIEESYDNPIVYFPDPVNIMSPLFLNDSCSPYTSPSSPCTLGNLASYAVNVSSADDAVAAFKFATEKNIRVVIKNTGHDYLGRSTGKGALSLWTHNLNEISYLNYTSEQYTGPAVKVGAGVQAFDLYKSAFENGFRVTGGFCPTVGLVGGWVSGGGHGALGSLYGLGADNALEFDVVTPDGQHLTASATENADLYWALSGGGGGTYGVVISMTEKVHKDGQTAGAAMTFMNTDDDAYWAAIESWQKQLLIFDDINGMNTFWGFTDKLFTLFFSTLPDADEAAIIAAFDPFISELKTLGVQYTYQTSQKPTFYEHFSLYTPDLPFGDYITNNTLGGWLIPRTTVQQNLTALMSVFRNITTKNPTHPFQINGVANNVTHQRVGNSADSNSVLPAWRDSLYWLNMDVDFALDGPMSVITDLQAEMNVNQNMLKALTPGGGAYINEATYDNPDWKQDYFGANYDQLLSIKQKYDPESILYGAASVGSDSWAPDSEGRLCAA
ncbi:hypothetical protein GGR50DRAFT_689810 [Xylaria sp. CBS 124048]|nr:hypothetical protein GGR50DRAFT_689810 [Xylaria sp. CBS 124048]